MNLQEAKKIILIFENIFRRTFFVRLHHHLCSKLPSYEEQNDTSGFDFLRFGG